MAISAAIGAAWGAPIGQGPDIAFIFQEIMQAVTPELLPAAGSYAIGIQPINNAFVGFPGGILLKYAADGGCLGLLDFKAPVPDMIA